MPFEPFNRETFIAAAQRRNRRRSLLFSTLAGFLPTFAAALAMRFADSEAILLAAVVAGPFLALLVSTLPTLPVKFRRCPRCRASLPGNRIRWNREEEFNVGPEWIAASGRCPNCEVVILSGQPASCPASGANALPKARPVLPTAAVVPFATVTLIIGTILFMLSTYLADQLLLSRLLLILSLAYPLFFLYRQGFPYRRPPLPCPGCGTDLRTPYLAAIAGDTGGCGFCGTQVVAGFIWPERSAQTAAERDAAVRRSRRQNLLVGLVFLLAALPLLFFFLTARHMAEHLPQVGRSVQGKITRIRQIDAGRNRSRQVQYIFTVKGIRYRGGGLVSAAEAEALRIGDPLELLYWGRGIYFSRPKGWRHETDFPTGIAGFWCVLFLLCAVVFFFAAWRKLRPAKGWRGLTLLPADRFGDEGFPTDARLAEQARKMELRLAKKPPFAVNLPPFRAFLLLLLLSGLIVAFGVWCLRLGLFLEENAIDPQARREAGVLLLGGTLAVLAGGAYPIVATLKAFAGKRPHS